MTKIEKIQIDPFGFREYDARWLYPKDINLNGVKKLGIGLGKNTDKNPETPLSSFS